MDQLDIFKPTIEIQPKDKINNSTKPPGLETYSKCMKTAFYGAIANFTLGFTALYCCQKMLSFHPKITHSAKYAGLLSALGASLFTYQTTTSYMNACEDKLFASIQQRGDSLLEKINNELDLRTRHVN